MSASESDRNQLSDEDKVFYKKGLCGLSNLGNTCFMNSIVQCINANRDFAKYILSDSWKEAKNKFRSSKSKERSKFSEKKLHKFKIE